MKIDQEQMQMILGWARPGSKGVLILSRSAFDALSDIERARHERDGYTVVVALDENKFEVK